MKCCIVRQGKKTHDHLTSIYTRRPTKNRTPRRLSLWLFRRNLNRISLFLCPWIDTEAKTKYRWKSRSIKLPASCGQLPNQNCWLQLVIISFLIATAINIDVGYLLLKSLCSTVVGCLANWTRQIEYALLLSNPFSLWCKVEDNVKLELLVRSRCKALNRSLRMIHSGAVRP